MADPKMQPARLADRNAVVTGSSRGIGRAVALALADHGARVVINGREPEPVADVVEAIRARGGSAVGCPGSVADFDQAGRLIDTCDASFGPIDVLVNCAGVAEPPAASILDMTSEAWHELLDAHLTSTFNCCRHAAPRMLASGGGSIVNTSSHAFLGVFGGTGYPAAKGGTNSLTLAMAAELREHGIRVNAVCPGARTRLATAAAEHIEDLHARGILDDGLRAVALDPPPPEHVGPLYVFLASDLAKNITGRIFSAFGGYVGLFGTESESLLAYRDHDAAGIWKLEELAEKLLGSKRL